MNAPIPDSSFETMSDPELVERLQARDSAAVNEFVLRFEPLVSRYARWLRVPEDERGHWVSDLLYDVAMTLSRGKNAMRSHLSAYVAGACRLRVREHRERQATYRTHILDALADVHAGPLGLREVVVASLASERSMRDARGPDWEPPPLAPVLERLVSALDEGVTPDERQMLRWLGDQLSYTLIAERLGITRPATVSRIQRLRLRLIEAALRFGASLDRTERADFVRFLRRTGVVAEDRVHAMEKPTTTVSDYDRCSDQDSR
jgi:DNA-binding CsgD family transcriptional regulator